MRIAFIVGGFPLISETFILNQITGLADRGHEVDVFARRRAPQGPVHTDVGRYNLLSRTHFFDLPRTRAGRLVRALGAFLFGLPRHPRVMLQCLKLWRYGSLYQVLNNLMHVVYFLDRRYDVVMCHFGGNGIDFAFLKDIFPRMGFITMFHRGDLLLVDEQGAAIYKLLQELGDAYLAIGETWHRRRLVEAGFDAQRIEGLPIGINLDRVRFHIRKRIANEFDILTVARLEHEKGLDIGLRAIRAIVSQNPGVQVRYRIVGEGSQHKALTDLIRALGLSANAVLLGALAGEDVLKRLDAAQVFLLPSRSEGTPTVLLEAQASGMPVVATDVGGVVDVVDNGRSGYVVPSEDADAIRDRLQSLLDHPECWKDMGEAGRRFVEKEHDITRLCAKLEGIFARTTAKLNAADGSRAGSPSVRG